MRSPVLFLRPKLFSAKSTLCSNQAVTTSHTTIFFLLLAAILLASLLSACTLAAVSVQDQNLAPMPDGWIEGYYPKVPNYAFLDDVVTFNGEETFRLEQGGMLDSYGIVDRAIWTESIPVTPGDSIYVSAWIQTDPSSLRDSTHGARIGVDFYAGGVLVDALQSEYVGWNTSTWTLREIYATVPDTMYPVDKAGNMRAIDAISFWLQALNGNDEGSAWFAHTILYVNPTPIIQPTPEPTQTQTPSPSPTSVPTPTLTQTPTPTVTATASPKPTPSPQATSTPTVTPTQTVNPTPTKTATPTSTVTPIGPSEPVSTSSSVVAHVEKNDGMAAMMGVALVVSVALSVGVVVVVVGKRLSPAR
jgi:hypothetical protein